MTRHTITRPLGAEYRGRLSLFVARTGELAAAQAIGISPSTLARAMAGLDVYGGTRAAIEHALSAEAAS